jgi:hypothetical protein
LSSSCCAPQQYKIEIGEGFYIKSSYQAHLEQHKRYLEKHGLLGQGILHFVNGLCDVVADQSEHLPAEEKDSLEPTLKRLMLTNESGELYYYLLHAHGAEAITYNAWARFNFDCNWNVCLRTFTDMPTSVLEEYGRKARDRMDKNLSGAGRREIMTAIGKRDDIYGIHSLPPEMVFSLLFES